MANLKGKRFDQQIKNAKIRLEARGQSRRNRVDYKTHSNALALKRDKYLSDFANYIKNTNGEMGKLNNYMNDQVISSFLQQRTEVLSNKTAIDYIRGFSALIDGLKSSKISIDVDKEVFNSLVSHVNIRSSEATNTEQNRDIKNLDKVFEKLSQKNLDYVVLAKVKSELGLRVSEAIELISKPAEYIGKDYLVYNLVGKGGFIYDPKPISSELISLIGSGINISYSSYQASLQEINITSHDFRFTYVKNRMTELLHQMSYKEALKIISKEINHNRESITEYYLSQTSF